MQITYTVSAFNHLKNDLWKPYRCQQTNTINYTDKLSLAQRIKFTAHITLFLVKFR